MLKDRKQICKIIFFWFSPEVLSACTSLVLAVYLIAQCYSYRLYLEWVQNKQGSKEGNK